MAVSDMHCASYGSSLDWSDGHSSFLRSIAGDPIEIVAQDRKISRRSFFCQAEKRKSLGWKA